MTPHGRSTTPHLPSRSARPASAPFVVAGTDPRIVAALFPADGPPDTWEHPTRLT